MMRCSHRLGGPSLTSQSGIDRMHPSAYEEPFLSDGAAWFEPARRRQCRLTVGKLPAQADSGFLKTAMDFWGVKISITPMRISTSYTGPLDALALTLFDEHFFGGLYVRDIIFLGELHLLPGQQAMRSRDDGPTPVRRCSYLLHPLDILSPTLGPG